MTKQTAKKFDILNGNIAERIQSPNPKIQEEARRELILCAKSNHNHQVFFKKSFSGSIISIPVARGQFFTTYSRLMKDWACTNKKARLQLEKWQKSGVVKVERLKDQKNFDIGLLITYNWLFEGEKERREKKGNRETTHKAVFNKAKTFDNSKKGNRKYEVLPKGNIQRKTTKKEIVVFSYKKDLGFEATATELEKLGFNTHRIEKFYIQYDQATLEKYLQLLNLCRERVKNPCAWFTQALKQAFDLQRVDNWTRQQEEQQTAEAEKQQAELVATREAEARQEQARKQAILIENWRRENGQEAEEKLVLEVMEEWKNSRQIIYQSIAKRRAGDQDLLDVFKQNVFVKAEVENQILSRLRPLVQV